MSVKMKDKTFWNFIFLLTFTFISGMAGIGYYSSSMYFKPLAHILSYMFSAIVMALIMSFYIKSNKEVKNK